MRRRRILGAAVSGLTVSIAGCGGETSDTTSTETDTPSPDGTARTETPTDAPTEEPEPELVVTDIEANTVAMVDDVVSTAVEVENRGGQSGGTTVRLDFNADEIETDVEQVPAGETRRVEESFSTDGIDTGQYTLEIAAAETTETLLIDVIPNQTEPGLYGVVRGGDGASIEGKMSITGRKDGDIGPVRIQVNGEQQLDVEHPFDRPYDLFPVRIESADTTSPEAGPILYPLAESREITDDIVLFDRFEVPPGIPTRIKIVDQAGDPVEGFDSVNLGDRNGVLVGPDRLTTGSEGYITDGNTTEIPVGPEPDGRLTVVARPPEGPFQEFGTVVGAEDRQEVTIEVSDPERFRE